MQLKPVVISTYFLLSDVRPT